MKNKENILVIDNNESVVYKHSDISSHTDILDLLVDDFLNTDNKTDSADIWKNICKCQERGQLYAVKSLAELNKIVKKTRDIELWLGFNCKWLDTTSVLKIISDDKSEVSLHEYKDNGKFIKIIDPAYPHQIILNCKMPHKFCKWQCVRVDDELSGIECVEKALTDFNGYENTYDNYFKDFRFIENPENYQALNFIKNLEITENYIPYIPALGELMIIFDNISAINFLLQLTKNDVIVANLTDRGKGWWTSTGYTDNLHYIGLWHVRQKTLMSYFDFQARATFKSHIMNALPFYKQID